MTNEDRIGAVTEFYETHPISEKQIVDRMKADGIDLDAVTEDILQNYDQDHYGGIAANQALAALAGIDADCRVLDVCCGLGGPSRWLAHNFGCRVTGIDLTESRITGAGRLTRMAGLDDRVAFRQGNALDLPFDDRTFDIVVSQEGFCHIPDKDRLVAECARVLKPGGRIAFTDILTTDRTSDAMLERLQAEMTFQDLSSRDGYRDRLECEGCEVVEIQDLGAEWRDILAERLAMYRGLKDQTVERFGESHFLKWDRAYSFFVGLYETGELGGGRFLARRIRP
ncbi:MAG TPA: methyltransferase domain-containing protein [Afifellaceae bacterium]|nr:methyltransferase domain-containing protein [Afifellaceae bacterium]